MMLKHVPARARRSSRILPRAEASAVKRPRWIVADAVLVIWFWGIYLSGADHIHRGIRTRIFQGSYADCWKHTDCHPRGRTQIGCGLPFPRLLATEHSIGFSGRLDYRDAMVATSAAA
jgi:hypothetical protein